MDEKSAFDLLLDYPIKNGLVYETHENRQRFFVSPNDPILNTKYILFETGNLVFCAYDSYAAKAYSTNTFTGIYGIGNFNQDFECKIYKRDWLDKLLRRNKIKSGDSFIDTRMTITSESEVIPHGLITKESLKLFDKINLQISPIEILIQNDYLSIVEKFKGKKVVGLETNQWLYKTEDLELFINSGSELINNILKSRLI